MEEVSAVDKASVASAKEVLCLVWQCSCARAFIRAGKSEKTAEWLGLERFPALGWPAGLGTDGPKERDRWRFAFLLLLLYSYKMVSHVAGVLHGQPISLLDVWMLRWMRSHPSVVLTRPIDLTRLSLSRLVP